MVLGVNGCKGCLGTTYNSSSSTSFAWVPNTDASSSYYDGTTYVGSRCTDKVCPVNIASICLTKF